MLRLKLVVNFRNKLVCSLLAVVLFSGSASWLFAVCAPSMGMHCPPGCPMMEHTAAGNQVSGQEPAGSCCHFRSNTSTPIAPARVTATSHTSMAKMKTTAAMPLPATQEKKVEPTSVAKQANPQTVLCTFLI
jgi:hypothetical protein